MDQRSEALARELLATARPEDGFHGEEAGRVTTRSGITWVVDPIDGTVNYLYGIPAYAVSVAAVVGDPDVPGAWRPVAGAVVEPVTGEAHVAHLGAARAWSPPRASGLSSYPPPRTSAPPCWRRASATRRRCAPSRDG